MIANSYIMCAMCNVRSIVRYGYTHRGVFKLSHFIHEDYKAQRGLVTCPKSQLVSGREDLNSGILAVFLALC